jgi:hypothetical protein
MSSPPDPPPRSLAAAFIGRRARITLAIAVALALAIRLLLPWALAVLGERIGSEQIGRIVQIDDLSLELLRSRAVARGVVIGPLLDRVEDPDAPIDPERALLAFSRLSVDWSWMRLLGGELRLFAVSLESPRVAVIRDTDGNLLPILVAPPDDDSEDDGEGETGAPLVVAIDTLRIRDLGMLLLDLSAAKPPMAIEMREFGLDDLRVEGGRVSLGAVSVDEPRLTLLRDANLATEFQGARAEAEDVEAAEAEPAVDRTALEIAQIDLKNAQLSLEAGDERLDATLAVHAENLSLEEGQRFPLRVELGVGGGEIELAGEAGANPPVFAGTLVWNGLEIGPLLRAGAGDVPLSVASGATSGTLRVDAAIATAPGRGPSQITLSGSVGISDLDAAEVSGRASLALQELAVEITRIHAELPGPNAPTSPPRIELASAEIRAPRIFYRRSAPAAGAAETEAEPPAAADPAPADRGPALSLARLELSDGQIDFEDTIVAPPHATKLRNVAIQATGLKWPDATVASLAIDMRGPQASVIAVQAALQQAAGDVTIDVKELPLTAYSPYAADAAGYRIERGSLSLAAKAHLAGERVDLDSDLTLRDLGVAEVSPGIFEKQFGMSLRLALALLRDPAGRIRLPVGGAFHAESGSGVSLVPIVASAMRQALVGALTSPIKGVGLLLAVGSNRKGGLLAPVRFAPGAVAAAGDDDLGGYAELLAARPDLGLVLRGRSGPADDPSLAIRRLADAARDGGELPAVSAGDAGFFERRRVVGALADFAEGEMAALDRLDPDDAALLARWRSQVEVSDADRDALARVRATALRDRLLAEHGLDAGRVTVGAPLAGEPAVVIELAPAD